MLKYTGEDPICTSHCDFTKKKKTRPGEMESAANSEDAQKMYDLPVTPESR